MEANGFKPSPCSGASAKRRCAAEIGENASAEAEPEALHRSATTKI